MVGRGRRSLRRGGVGLMRVCVGWHPGCGTLRLFECHEQWAADCESATVAAAVVAGVVGLGRLLRAAVQG